MAIQTRPVEYRHENVTFEGLLAWDDAITGPRPAVAISHSWAGRSAFEEDKAVELARQGYTGFALDMYGKGVCGVTPEENSALMAPLMEDRALLQARIAAAVAVLGRQAEVIPGKIAAIGYCFGGLCVLDLARAGGDVRGVVSFHGLFGAPDNIRDKRIGARVLCLHGFDDPMAQPPAMLELAAELTAAEADWQIHAYGGTMHAFTNPAANNREMGTVYNAAADNRSRVALHNFLQEIFA